MLRVKSLLVLIGLFLFLPFSLSGKDSEEETKSTEPAKAEEKTEKESSTQTEKKDEKEETKKEEEKPAEETTTESKHGPTPLTIGNFSLPTSQQIAPLIGFGQLVAGTDVLQYYLVGNLFWGNRLLTSTLLPSILYGVTDQVDIYLQLPFILENHIDDQTSAGLGDIVLQFEYAYYTYTTKCYSNQATVVATILYPSGDPDKEPPTGFGAPSFFLGGTFSHTDRWWYAFFSTGELFSTENHRSKFGDQFLYQWGFEKVICARKDRMIFAWMVEIDGTYTKKNRINGLIDRNSGGNVLLMTPSLWYSTKKWILQGGIGIPLVQQLNGHQPKTNLALLFIIGRNF